MAKEQSIERGTDEAFVQLMMKSGSSILKLLGLPPEKTDNYQFRSVVVKKTRFEPDVEGIPMFLSDNEPVFIEFQGYKDPFIRYRLLAEILQGCIQQSYPKEVIAGIIYTDASFKKAALPISALKATNGDQIHYDLKEIVLTDYTEEQLLTTDPKLVVLAPFALSADTHKATLLAKSQEWVNLITQVFPTEQRQEILDILGLFVLNRFRSLPYKEVIAMLKFDLMDTVAGRQVFDMGLQKGIQEGLQEGLQKWSIGTNQELVIEALDERFNVVPIDISQQIRAIEQRDVLKSLFREAIRCPDIESFKKRVSQTV
jgi:predicted transposase YdaD